MSRVHNSPTLSFLSLTFHEPLSPSLLFWASLRLPLILQRIPSSTVYPWRTPPSTSTTGRRFPTHRFGFLKLIFRGHKAYFPFPLSTSPSTAVEAVFSTLNFTFGFLALISHCTHLHHHFFFFVWIQLRFSTKWVSFFSPSCLFSWAVFGSVIFVGTQFAPGITRNPFGSGMDNHSSPRSVIKRIQGG